VADLLVSIIVPSRNQGQFILEALESILSQDYRPLEVLVMDGASNDGTVEVLRSMSRHPELRWWSEPDSGVVEAVNKGLAMARGTVAAIQSSDDAYLPGAVAAAAGAMASDPGLALIYGDVLRVDVDGRELGRTSLPAYSLEALLALEMWIPQPAAFFSLAVARELGGWRPEVAYVADTDLWLRIALSRKVRKLDRVLGKRRIHPAQRDRNGAAIIRDYTLMLQTVPELSARGDLRRAAAAGRQVIRLRYGYGAGHLTTVLRSWGLVWLRPKALTRLGTERLIPFLGPARRALTRAARWVRRRSRA
jgi:glycosyltransferase involved in cell wall biosynthesis